MRALRRKPKGEQRIVATVEVRGARFRACDRWVSFVTSDAGRSVHGELRVFCGVQHVGWLLPDDDRWRWATSEAFRTRESRATYASPAEALRAIGLTAWGRRIAATERGWR